MVRRHFRFRRLLLGLAFGAIAAPVAQAQPTDSGFWTERPVTAQISPHGGVTPTMSQLQAEAQQWGETHQQSSSQPSIHGGVTPTMSQLQAAAQQWRETHQQSSSQPSIHGGVTPTMSQLQAEAARYRASHDNAQKVSTSRSDGFNWTDAGIGAAVTFGAAAVLLAAIAVGRRYRSRPDRAGLAST